MDVKKLADMAARRYAKLSQTGALDVQIFGKIKYDSFLAGVKWHQKQLGKAHTEDEKLTQALVKMFRANVKKAQEKPVSRRGPIIINGKVYQPEPPKESENVPKTKRRPK